MNFTAPSLLSEAHDASAFDSGEVVLDDWLRKRALQNLHSLASRTYVVCPEGETRIAGFFALTMGQILAQEATGAMRRNMARAIPAVVLARLAIDRAFQGQGFGRALLADAITRSLRAGRQVAAWILVVHAISPAAEAFYAHHGFARLPVETPTFALDLMKFERIRGGG